MNNRLEGSTDSQRPIDYGRLLEAFIQGREANNCSLETGKFYRRMLPPFFRTHGGIPLEAITRTHVESFLGGRKEAGKSPFYVAGFYRALHAFFRWCVEEEFIEKSPMRNMHITKTPKLKKGVLPREDFEKLLSVCPKGTFTGARERAILTLLWTTGMRLAELSNLKIEDMDRKARRIKLFGKGAKERYVPYSPEAQMAVDRYMFYRRDDLPNLWLTEERTPLTQWGIVSMTRAVQRRAGVKLDDMHHIFRRSFIRRNIHHIDARAVQTVVGHEDLSTTQKYLEGERDDAVVYEPWH